MHCGELLVVVFTDVCDDCGINWNKVFLHVPPSVLVLMRLVFFLVGDLTGAGADLVRGRFVCSLNSALPSAGSGWRSD